MVRRIVRATCHRRTVMTMALLDPPIARKFRGDWHPSGAGAGSPEGRPTVCRD